MPDVIQRSADPSRMAGKAHGPAKARNKPRPTERLQDLIGEHLRLYYAELVDEPVPDKLTALIDRLAERDRRR